MRFFLLLLALAYVTPGRAYGQATPAPSDSARADTTLQAHPPDSEYFSRPLRLGEVVVTATRSLKSIEQVPAPTSVIGAAEIEAQGAVRLSDLLAAQPGLQLSYDHGTGVQVQGFDADYTLILVDGEPVVGRTAGTLDLDRIAVSAVERVEIVRGPSSSLYGSEALAGVVNIITKSTDAPLQASVQARYGTHATSDLTSRIAGRQGAVQGSLFLSRYRSGGYDLQPATVAPTRPAFTDYVGRGTLSYRLGPQTDLTVRARAAHEAQSSSTAVNGATQQFDNDATRTDWSLAPRLTHTWRPGLRLEARFYGSGYRTQADLTGQNDGAVFSRSRYDQRYGKAEAQLQAVLSARHLLTAGAGFVAESVDADRLVGDRTGGFVFVQDEWQVASRLGLVPSVRLDAHSDYAMRISPKLAALATPVDGLRLRASAGSGYKAPAFRQLYLSFTNASAGYSVFGAEEVQEGLARLDRQGQLQAYLADVEALGGAIEAERSVAVNVGFDLDLVPGVSVRVNGFHNEVRDLIDTQPVARKTNGQQVFTYFNRGRVFTRGVEAELSWRPSRALEAALSYTLLDAKDRDVLDDLAAGRIYRRTEAGRDVAVATGDYGGLPGRSRHRGTLRLRYRYAPLGVTTSVQARYRGRYAFADRNGNGIVDVASEYAPGYAALDVTLTKTLFAEHVLQVGAENLTGHTDPQYVPFLPGREWFAGLRFRF